MSSHAPKVETNESGSKNAKYKTYQLEDMIRRSTEYRLTTAGIGTVHNYALWFMQLYSRTSVHQGVREAAEKYRMELASMRMTVQTMINDLQKGDDAMVETHDRCRFNNIFVPAASRDMNSKLLSQATLIDVVEQTDRVCDIFTLTYAENCQHYGVEGDANVGATLGKVRALFTNLHSDAERWYREEPYLAPLTWDSPQAYIPPPKKAVTRQYNVATQVTEDGVEYCSCIIPQVSLAEMKTKFVQFLYVTEIGEDKIHYVPILFAAAQREAVENSPHYSKHQIYLGKVKGRPTHGTAVFHTRHDHTLLQSMNICHGVEEGHPLLTTVLMTQQQWNSVN